MHESCRLNGIDFDLSYENFCYQECVPSIYNGMDKATIARNKARNKASKKSKKTKTEK